MIHRLRIPRRIGQSLIVAAWAGVVSFGMDYTPTTAIVAALVGAIIGLALPTGRPEDAT